MVFSHYFSFSLKFSPRIYSVPFIFLFPHLLCRETHFLCKKPVCQFIALFLFTIGLAKNFFFKSVLLAAVRKINFSQIIILECLTFQSIVLEEKLGFFSICFFRSASDSPPLYCVVLGSKPQVSHMQDICSTNEFHNRIRVLGISLGGYQLSCVLRGLIMLIVLIPLPLSSFQQVLPERSKEFGGCKESE